jgi:hypothetical protein
VEQVGSDERIDSEREAGTERIEDVKGPDRPLRGLRRSGGVRCSVNRSDQTLWGSRRSDGVRWSGNRPDRPLWGFGRRSGGVGWCGLGSRSVRLRVRDSRKSGGSGGS